MRQHRGASTSLDFSFKRQQDHVQNIIENAVHIVALDPQHAKARSLQKLRSPLVVGDLIWFGMSCAIHFNNEPLFPANVL